MRYSPEYEIFCLTPKEIQMLGFMSANSYATDKPITCYRYSDSYCAGNLEDVHQLSAEGFQTLKNIERWDILPDTPCDWWSDPLDRGYTYKDLAMVCCYYRKEHGRLPRDIVLTPHFVTELEKTAIEDFDF